MTNQADRKLCNCKNAEECGDNATAEDQWCRQDYNNGIYATDQQAEIDELVKLLEVSACPNESCAEGTIPHQVGDNEWEQEQCQFCYEKGEAIAKHQKAGGKA
jgi:hypothetical protein